MPPVFPPLKAGSIGELAAMLGLDRAALEATVAQFNAAVRPGHLRPHGARRLRAPRAWRRPRPTGRAGIDTPPFYGYPLRPGITFTYLGVAIDETRAHDHGRRQAVPERLRRGRDHGGQRARPGLPRGHRHGDRHHLRAHRRRGGGSPCHAANAPRLEELVEGSPARAEHLQRLPLLRGLLRGVSRARAAPRVHARATSTTSPTCATTAARASTPASTRRRTSSSSTSRACWRRCARRPTASTPGPRSSARLFERNGLVVSLATAAGIAFLFIFTALVSDPVAALPGVLGRAGLVLRGAPAQRDGGRSSARCPLFVAARLPHGLRALLARHGRGGRASSCARARSRGRCATC